MFHLGRAFGTRGSGLLSVGGDSAAVAGSSGVDCTGCIVVWPYGRRQTSRANSTAAAAAPWLGGYPGDLHLGLCVIPRLVLGGGRPELVSAGLADDPGGGTCDRGSHRGLSLAARAGCTEFSTRSYSVQWSLAMAGRHLWQPARAANDNPRWDPLSPVPPPGPSACPAETSSGRPPPRNSR